MESTTTPTTRLELDGQSQRLADVVAHTKRQLASVEDDLRRQAHQLKADMDTVLERLDAGHHLSPQGELQNSALRFDLACQRRQLLVAQLEQLRHVTQEDS